MSIIAWDGNILASDRMAVNGETVALMSKLYKVPNLDIVLGFIGDIAKGLMLCEWYREGAQRDLYPKFQLTDDWAYLIVLKEGIISFYEHEPVPIQLESKLQSWGSGKNFAIGAMSAGKTAIEAVQIASLWSNTCGFGVSYYDVRTKKLIIDSKPTNNFIGPNSTDWGLE